MAQTEEERKKIAQPHPSILERRAAEAAAAEPEPEPEPEVEFDFNQTSSDDESEDSLEADS